MADNQTPIDELKPPYLLFVGDAQDPLALKTARGIAHWRPDICLGQFRTSPDAASLDLPDLSLRRAFEMGARTLVLGTVSAGGALPSSWCDDLCQAAELGFDIANGLHQRLQDIPQLVQTAQRVGTRLIDVRVPGAPPPVGSGAPRTGRRVLTIGTDCNLGKMYTALAVDRELQARGESSEFKATGQTGILIAGSGVPLDAVVSDFLSGAIEQLSPAVPADRWHVIEGQGSLHHPSFAGVTLGLVHGAQPDFLVVCHEPTRQHMRHAPQFPLPSLAETVAAGEQAARRTNPDVRCAGFSINTAALGEREATSYLQQVSQQFGLPACDPVRFASQPQSPHHHARLVDQLLAGR